MSADPTRAKSIFLNAGERPAGPDRDAYLREACGADADLRREVDDLLAHEARVGSFLEGPDATPTIDGPGAGEAPGTVLAGRYKLLEPVGEGGMGEVWMAQQTEPVRRLVAVKLIKPGMASKQVLARFEAERQALALMDHPNIAKVHDGGVTADGRPYFVMELVKGVPITKYCDEHHLTPRQRLGLFVPVCQAVQHAHQKGVIHRDLKPSNVLVALYDDKPVPKVIDFGVAKTTGQQLTEATLHTGFGAVVGTVEYMSPEQATFNQLDVDTRSDIYSLGVLLYELLAGSPPFGRKELEKAGVLEMLRVIREQEPSKPSTKLSTADRLPTLAANRGTEPAKLTRLVRGELDWIVMKALEKDRARRYESANGFAADVQRYLADEPVLACPPSAGYRLRKFVRRNKRSLAASVVLGLALLVAVGAVAGSIGWASRDRAARRAEAAQRAGESLVRARALVAEDKSRPARQELAAARARIGTDRAALSALTDEIDALDAELRRFERFLELVDQAHDAEIPQPAEPAVQAETNRGMTSFADRLRSPERDQANAVPFLLEALSCYEVMERHDWISALEGGSLGPAQVSKVRRTVYEELLWLAGDIARRRQDHRSSGRGLTGEEAGRLGLAYLAKAEEAFRPTAAFHVTRASCRQALGELEAARGDTETARRTPAALAVDHYLLGFAALNARNRTEAVKQFEAALRVEPTHYWSLMQLGVCLEGMGKDEQDFTAAVVAYTGCVMRRPEHPAGYVGRGNALRLLGRVDDAVADYSRAIELKPDYWRAWHNRSLVHSELGRHDKAVADGSKAIEINPNFSRPWSRRGDAYRRRGESDKALADLSKAVELDPKDPGPRSDRGAVYCDLLKQYDEAIAEFSDAIDLDPKFKTAWFNRGIAHKALGRYDKAIADYSKAIDLDPKYAAACYQRGVVYADELKQYDKALADFSKAIELKPDYREAWSGRILVYAVRNRWDQAVADQANFLAGHPNDPQAWYRLGLLRIYTGDADGYRKVCADMVRHFDGSEDRNVVHHLVWTCALGPNAVTDFRPLLQAAEALAAKNPKDWWHMNRLGVALYRAGRPEAAVATLNEATQLSGWEGYRVRDWLLLAMAHHSLGHTEEAGKRLAKAVDWMATQKDPVFWDWLQLLVLRREAESLIRKRAADPKPTGGKKQ